VHRASRGHLFSPSQPTFFPPISILVPQSTPMGNLCGKESSPSSFSAPGRVLGSAPDSTNTAPSARIPSTRPRDLTGSGKALGSSSLRSDSTLEGLSDAREAAARAAEACNARQANGKLGSQLEQQKRKTLNKQLAELSKAGGKQEQLVWD